MFCVFVGCLPGITGYHRVSPGITGYHSTRLFFGLRACGAPLTRPGGRATLSCPPGPRLAITNSGNNLLSTLSTRSPLSYLVIPKPIKPMWRYLLGNCQRLHNWLHNSWPSWLHNWLGNCLSYTVLHRLNNLEPGLPVQGLEGFWED